MQILSVAIITFNEEQNIAACIENAIIVADEIIIVDSFSTDNTVKIAKSYGVKVISNIFVDYAQQKNFALSQCSSPFVLSLDADERMDAIAMKEVLEEKNRNFPHDGYIFKRITFIGNKPIKHGTWYPDKKLRLIQKEKANWVGKGVHEKLIIKSTNIFTLNGHLLHYSYKNKEDLLVKTKKYAQLAANYLHAENKKISSLFIPIKALARFFKHYFLKCGFIEGSYGWLIGKQQYYEALWKYKGLFILNKKAKKKVN